MHVQCPPLAQHLVPIDENDSEDGWDYLLPGIVPERGHLRSFK